MGRPAPKPPASFDYVPLFPWFGVVLFGMASAKLGVARGWDKRLGLTVGRDVDIIGVGNAIEGERMSPSLSTVGPVDFFERVARLLLKRAVDAGSTPAAPPGVLDFPWQLFVRESAPHRSAANRLY